MGCEPRRVPTALAALLVAAPAVAAPRFVEHAAELGLDFTHRDFRNGEKYYIETTSSGGGWLDYDGDGDLDVYLLNGAPPPEDSTPAPANVLFEQRDGTFVDVTATAGVGDTGFGMGLCAGDFDGDGRLDLFVTNYGADRLYRNRGDRSFEEVAAERGIDGEHWSASCAFADFDGDGDLDLYVARYNDFRYETNPPCGDEARRLRLYCQPSQFAGVPDALWINRGDGTFRDEAASRGLAGGALERGLGVLASDLDADGDIDIYVSNDGTPNRLYVNDGTGRFRDRALESGTAVSGFGRPEAGMGIARGDVDGDGLADLLVSHFTMESNTLYLARDVLQFDDGTFQAGLEQASYRNVGWGAALFDADNDGDLDLAVANGHIQEGVDEYEPSQSYRQPSQLFENRGDGTFVDVSGEAAAFFSEPHVSRALAVGDYNDDGRLDLLVTRSNDTPVLLENRSDAGHWLGIELRGPPHNVHALGARVELAAGGRTLAREVRSGGSYQSQDDLRIHFGLGATAAPVEVVVYWPDGTTQRETIAETDRYVALSHPDAPR